MRRRELLAGVAGAAAVAAWPGRAVAMPGGRDELIRTVEGLLHGTRAVAAEPVALPVLRAAVAGAGADYQAARYRQVAAALPRLVATATATREAAAGGERARAEALLAEAYALTSQLMVKVNADGAALVAADRAVQAAGRGEDPLTLAGSRRAVATALRRTGRREAAQALLTSAAAEIEPSGRVPGAQLSMYGSLLTTAAYTAAVDGNRSAAADLIGEAAAVASRLGHDGNYRSTAFGPTNVLIYRISISQVLGDSGAAVQHARSVDVGGLRTAERRGRYWIDLARAYDQWGKAEECYRALLAAERDAPGDLRYRPPVHRMVAGLLHVERRHTLPGLRGFAARVGLPG